MRVKIAQVIALIALAMTISLTSAHAQSARSMTFSLPFDSVAGKSLLPRGEYTLRIVDGITSKAIFVSSADGRHKFATAQTQLMSVGNNRQTSGRAKLVFNRYGSQYFLSQVWAGDGNVRQLFQSKAEREIAKGARLAKSERAEQTSVVLLAGQ